MPKVLKVFRDLLVLKVNRGLLDLLVQQGLKVKKAIPVNKDLLDLKGLKV